MHRSSPQQPQKQGVASMLPTSRRNSTAPQKQGVKGATTKTTTNNAVNQRQPCPPVRQAPTNEADPESTNPDAKKELQQPSFDTTASCPNKPIIASSPRPVTTAVAQSPVRRPSPVPQCPVAASSAAALVGRAGSAPNVAAARPINSAAREGGGGSSSNNNTHNSSKSTSLELCQLIQKQSPVPRRSPGVCALPPRAQVLRPSVGVPRKADVVSQLHHRGGEQPNQPVLDLPKVANRPTTTSSSNNHKNFFVSAPPSPARQPVNAVTQFNMNGSSSQLDLMDVEASIAAQEPRAIDGTAGSRIRVVFGKTGSDFLLLLDEDDGNCSWQAKSWYNVPPGLDQQLRTVDYVHQCSFLEEEWFLSARCKTTGITKSWWKVESLVFHQALTAAVKGGLHVRVVFGDSATGQFIILLGTNGYTLGANLPQPLLKALDHIYDTASTIAKIRGVNSNGRFLLEESIAEDHSCSEESGFVRSVYHSQGLSPHLLQVLESSSASDSHEIAMGSSDKSWVVVHDDTYLRSVGVHDELARLLDEFYARHKRRQETRDEEIAIFQENERLKAQQAKLAAAEERIRKQKQATEDMAMEKKLEKELEVARHNRRQKLESVWIIANKRRDKEDRISEIQSKYLNVGDKVTVLGLSTKPGDACVSAIVQKEGFIVVDVPVETLPKKKRNKVGKDSAVTISDPRRLIKYVEEDVFDERSELFLLALAEDKYEAAAILYHGHIESGACVCKRDFMSFSLQLQQPSHWRVGDRVNVIGYANGIVTKTKPKYAHKLNLVHVQYDDGTSYHVPDDQVRPLKRFVVPGSCSFRTLTRREEESALRIRPLFEMLEPKTNEVQSFDEHKCAEKIDLRRLQKLVANLQSDCNERRTCMEDLVERLEEDPTNYESDYCYRKLEQCYDLEETIYTLYDFLKSQPMDEDGCLVHQVQYRHRDAGCRGRLFAMGRSVRVLDAKFPRSLTLQGVQSELRAPLTGAFAYDIDCENSDVRLLCSLACHLGLDEMIPTLKDYRNFREMWLEAIHREHPEVNKAEIKRLANAILCGGTYETWLRAVDEPKVVPKVKRFGFRLYAEVRALRDQLLVHPRFQWTNAERERLERDGLKGEAVKMALFTGILQSCENEVLGIVHRTFHNRGWHVRAKMFDGILVERGPKAKEDDCSIEDMIRLTERTCEAKGWDVHLVEKPLHGLQNNPLQTIVEARATMRAFRNTTTTTAPAENAGTDALTVVSIPSVAGTTTTEF